MAVVIETTLGDFTVDLYTEERPQTCKNFLKLCKIKYYNFCLFHSVQANFLAQTGDPTGSGMGGESVFGIVYGEDARYYEAEKLPKLKHTKPGLLSMVNCGNNMLGSQFFLTLGSELQSLDEHCIFAEITEGMDILLKLNEAICDSQHRPYKDIRITHTVILDDPFEDLSGLVVPDASPERNHLSLANGRIGADEEIDETAGLTSAEVEEMKQDREAKARATILEIVGDLPDAEMAPPENVLFVCKLNPVTNDDDLEIIFSRFGKVKSCEVIRDHDTGDSLQYAFVEFEDQKSCEEAFFKMDNVLIDDRRIHVDFSQSVAKMRWRGKGRGVEYLDKENDKGKDRSRQPDDLKRYYKQDQHVKDINYRKRPDEERNARKLGGGGEEDGDVRRRDRKKDGDCRKSDDRRRKEPNKFDYDSKRYAKKHRDDTREDNGRNRHNDEWRNWGDERQNHGYQKQIHGYHNYSSRRDDSQNRKEGERKRDDNRRREGYQREERAKEKYERSSYQEDSHVRERYSEKGDSQDQNRSREKYKEKKNDTPQAEKSKENGIDEIGHSKQGSKEKNDKDDSCQPSPSKTREELSKEEYNKSVPGSSKENNDSLNSSTNEMITVRSPTPEAKGNKQKDKKLKRKQKSVETKPKKKRKYSSSSDSDTSISSDSSNSSSSSESASSDYKRKLKLKTTVAKKYYHKGKLVKVVKKKKDTTDSDDSDDSSDSGRKKKKHKGKRHTKIVKIIQKRKKRRRHTSDESDSNTSSSEDSDEEKVKKKKKRKNLEKKKKKKKVNNSIKKRKKSKEESSRSSESEDEDEIPRKTSKGNTNV